MSANSDQCRTIRCQKPATVRVRWIDRGYTEPAPKTDAHCEEHGRRKARTLGGTVLAR
jgi:hypothetical protein